MSQARDEFEDEPLWNRVTDNPRPAVLWAVAMLALLAVEFGAVASTVMSMPWEMVVGGLADNLPGPLASALTSVGAALAGVGDRLADLPTLLDRSVVPNQGYNPPGPGWEGTFLGLAPAYAWAIRVVLVYAYGFFLLYWLWRGYLVFREHYRYAEWTPTDDVIDRLRRHRWGQFGMVVVTMFVIMALFAPTLGPTAVDANIKDPYSNHVEYWDENANSVGNVTVGAANLASASKGDSQNFGIGSYDKHGRFHPFGTLDSGKDLFTFMAAGARVSLFIGLLASLIAGSVALGLALLTAYYKGLYDLIAVIVSDSFMAMPRLLVLIMLAVVLSGTWIAELYSGAFLLALLFGIWGWPALWRAVRGPAFQTVENEWIDAAESFGQKPHVLVRKHVAPYVIGYLLIYLSMSLGGYMIGTAGLSFLGLGVQSPTPEWGRAVSTGQEYVTSASWHISILPGVAITLVVVAFNALGDGIRDAIDPKSEGASADEVAAAGGGA
jgi:peptide/nickel transport system permease protein